MNHFILKHKQLSEVEAFVTVHDGIILTCADITEEGFLGVKGIVGHSISEVYEDFHVIETCKRE